MPGIKGCVQPTLCSEEAKKERLRHPCYLTTTGHNQTHPKLSQMQAETALNNQTFQVALPSALSAGTAQEKQAGAAPLQVASIWKPHFAHGIPDW